MDLVRFTLLIFFLCLHYQMNSPLSLLKYAVNMQCAEGNSGFLFKILFLSIFLLFSVCICENNRSLTMIFMPFEEAEEENDTNSLWETIALNDGSDKARFSSSSSCVKPKDDGVDFPV